jgi:hypothetical protein
MDFEKRDLTVSYGGRTFAVRTYHEQDQANGAGWHAVIVENHTPLHRGQGVHASPSSSLAEAVWIVSNLVDAQAGSGSRGAEPNPAQKWGRVAETVHDTQEGLPMPRYEVVAHLVVTSTALTPEEAATVLKREVLAAAPGAVELRSLAVWPAAQSPSPLPDSLRQQLAVFFTGVEQRAMLEEDAFRARVAEILLGAAIGNEPEAQVVQPEGEELNATASWESEGGAAHASTHEGITS